MRISDWSSDVCSSDLEMVRNVTDMQIQYHHPGLTGFVDADAIGTNWGLVDATRITLRFESANAHVSTEATPITRELSATVTLRRSEEHTSELPSLMRISYAVFCLKKKTKTVSTRNTPNTRNKSTPRPYYT